MPFPQIVVPEGVSPEQACDVEIEAFQEFFQRELSNDPLVRSERAILKTYLFWKTRALVDQTLASSSDLP